METSTSYICCVFRACSAAWCFWIMCAGLVLKQMPSFHTSLPSPPSRCSDSMRDIYLFYLLRIHGLHGRSLVFCSAISAVRRVGALLQHLHLPAYALHAQQQQRQRLKVRLQGGRRGGGGRGEGVMAEDVQGVLISLVHKPGSSSASTSRPMQWSIRVCRPSIAFPRVHSLQRSPVQALDCIRSNLKRVLVGSESCHPR